MIMMLIKADVEYFSGEEYQRIRDSFEDLRIPQDVTLILGQLQIKGKLCVEEFEMTSDARGRRELYETMTFVGKIRDEKE